VTVVYSGAQFRAPSCFNRHLHGRAVIVEAVPVLKRRASNARAISCGLSSNDNAGD
jgi:hypothetical protein